MEVFKAFIKGTTKKRENKNLSSFFLLVGDWDKKG